MNKNKLKTSNRIVRYEETEQALVGTNSKAGYFLLKDGTISADPRFEQEIGIMIDDNLYIPLVFTARVSKQAATGFYKIPHKNIPTVYEALRFTQNIAKINEALEKIGLEDSKYPDNGNICIWDEASFAAATLNEKRYCVIIEKIKPNKEPVCEYIASRLVLYNKRQLFQLKNFQPVPLRMYMHCSGLDLLFAEVGKTEMLFARDQQLHLTFLGTGRVYTKLLDEDLLVIDSELYQIWQGKLIPLTMYNARHSFVGYEEGMMVIYEDRYSEQDSMFAAYLYYKKDKQGLYKYDHEKII